MEKFQYSDTLAIPQPAGQSLTPIEYIGAGANGFVLKVSDESNNYSALKIVPVIVQSSEKKDGAIKRESKFYQYMANAKKIPNLARATAWWSIENVETFVYFKWHKALRKRFNTIAIDIPSRTVKETQGEFKLCVHFVQMQYYASGNLKTWLTCNSDKCAETYELRIELFCDTLSAVDFLHQRGLIHRDICPNNIFLAQDNHRLHAVLGDFDSIVSCGEQAQWPLTKVRETFTRTMGTDPYAAPEIDGGNYGKECDLFSLGVVATNIFFNILDYSGLRYAVPNIRENNVFPTCIFSEDATLWVDIIKAKLSGTPEHRLSSCKSMELIKTGLRLRQESSIKGRKSSLYLLESHTNGLINLKNFGSRWLELPSMPEPKLGGFSVAACAGKMYSIGGEEVTSQKVTNLVQLYDTQTGWQDWPPMQERRKYCGAAALGGRLFVVGGWKMHALSSAEECDLETGRWAQVAPMKAARWGMGVTTLGNLLVVMGGYDGQSYLSSAEFYDPRAGRWTNSAPMHVPRSRFGCAALGDRIYITGGLEDNWRWTASVEWFDFRAGRWTCVRNMSAPRAEFALAALNEQLLAAGGDTSECKPLDTVEVYDEKRDGWSTLDVRLPRGSRWVGCVV